jgi:cysteine desulfurase
VVWYDVVLSNDSVCTKDNQKPSHVILVLGYSEERARCSLRFGLGRENTETDVDFVVNRLAMTVQRLRQLVAV